MILSPPGSPFDLPIDHRSGLGSVSSGGVPAAKLSADFQAAARLPYSPAAPDTAEFSVAPREKLQGIEKWALANQRESRIETFQFWSLKIPVIVASAGSSIMVKYNLDLTLIIAGALSGACVLVDGITRPGALRKFHHKAYFELSTLVDDIYAKWQRGLDSRINLNELAQKLFDQIIAKSKEVSDYLVEVETTDKGTTKSTQAQATR